MPSECWLTCN